MIRTAGRKVRPDAVNGVPADCAVKYISVTRTGVIQPEHLIPDLSDFILPTGVVLPETGEINAALLVPLWVHGCRNEKKSRRYEH